MTAGSPGDLVQSNLCVKSTNSRCGYTGEDGVEISCPADRTVQLAEVAFQYYCEYNIYLRPSLMQAILASGGQPRMAGLGARDSLRLEVRTQHPRLLMLCSSCWRMITCYSPSSLYSFSCFVPYTHLFVWRQGCVCTVTI